MFPVNKVLQSAILKSNMRLHKMTYALSISQETQSMVSSGFRGSSIEAE